MLPAVLLLALVFVAPLIWFFVSTLASIGTPPEIASHALAVITSKAVAHCARDHQLDSLLVTVLVLLISYPLAYHLADAARGMRFTLVLFCIVVPYFTSIIVRTYSWMVLLGPQRHRQPVADGARPHRRSRCRCCTRRPAC